MNKTFVKMFDSKLNFSILAIQGFVGLFLVVLLKRLGVIHYPDMSLEILISWIPAAIFNVGMITTSLLAFFKFF